MEMYFLEQERLCKKEEGRKKGVENEGDGLLIGGAKDCALFMLKQALQIEDDNVGVWGTRPGASDPRNQGSIEELRITRDTMWSANLGSNEMI